VGAGEGSVFTAILSLPSGTSNNKDLVPLLSLSLFNGRKYTTGAAEFELFCPMTSTDLWIK
jgi:hypothetical protein